MPVSTSSEILQDFNETSDKELMEWVALRSDDGMSDAAFAYVFNEYKGYVWKILCSHIQRWTGETEIMDLMQETFIRVWERADTYSGEGTIKSWIGSITRNLANDWLDTRKGLIVTEGEYDEEQLISISQHAPNPDEEDTYENELYQEALGTLTPRERDIMTLYYEFLAGRNPQNKTPRNYLQNIYHKFNLSNDSLRQIRRRAKLKIEKYVKSKLNGG